MHLFRYKVYVIRLSRFIQYHICMSYERLRHRTGNVRYGGAGQRGAASLSWGHARPFSGADSPA
eukprot:2985369-Pleurochrysis_carterae.AAC.1